MILSNVNIGTGPSAGDGDPLRSAFGIINNNFQIVTNNVNALTNSVNSVAGRTGNVILTVNDIVGLNSTVTQANINAANVGMRGYVDATVAANIALLVNAAPSTLDTIRELADAIGDDPNFAVNIALSVSSANTKMRAYVDGQITAANAGVTSANLGMKGYVDSVASQSIYGNSNVASFLTSYSGNLNAKYATFTGDSNGATGLNALAVGSPGIEIFGNTIAQFHSNINGPVLVSIHNQNLGNNSTAGFMVTADIGDENNYRTLVGKVGSNFTPVPGYIYPLDSTLLGVGGNLLIASLDDPIKSIVFVVGTLGTVTEVLRLKTTDDLLSANLELGSNVGILFNDGTRQTSAYSNVQTATFTNLSTYAYNANVTAANVGMKGYVDSVASQSIYGNSNVRSYLTGGFDGNILPSANVAYSLGSITNQWKDLFVSNSTIYLGGVPLSITNGNLTVNGNAVSGGSTYANVDVKTYLENYDGDINGSVGLVLRGQTYDVEIQANSAGTAKTWGFYTDGRLSLPGSIEFYDDQAIVTPSATSIKIRGSSDDSGAVFDSAGESEIYANTNVYIYSDQAGSQKTWNFTQTGNLVFPDNTVQTTAYTSGSSYSNVQVATYLPTYTGNVAAGNVLVTTAYRFASGAVTITNDSSSVVLTPDTGANALAGVKIGGNGYLLGPNGSRNITLNYNGIGGAVGLQGNVTVGTAGGGNLFVVGNVIARDITAGNILTNGSITFADTTTQTTAWTGTVAGGSVSGNVAEASLAYAVNISPVLLNQEYPLAILPTTSGAYGVKSSDGTVGFTFNPSKNRMIVGNVQLAADGNIRFADGTVQTTAASYSNVQVATYLPTYTGTLTAGNVTVPGTSGKIGFSSGGFVQQATSNSTQVTSNTTSGNIQLMNLNLGVNSAHTLAFGCNKLTTNDMLVIKHISGGLTNIYVDAYVQTDGLAIIWMRNISGGDTGNFTPMLKYAIIQVPSS